MDPKELKENLDRIGEEAKAAATKTKTELEAAMKDKASSAELATLKELTEQAQEGAQKALDELRGIAEKQGLELNSLKERGADKGDIRERVQKALQDTLTANKDAIAQVGKAGQGTIKLDVSKAAGTITSANFGAGVLQGLRLPGIDPLDRNPNFIMNEITVINGGPGSDPFSVVEKVPKEGGAAPVAEGNVKPFYDWTYAEKKATAETIAAIVPVSKQALLRMPQLYGHITEELMAEVEEVLQEQIILGNGVSPNLNGIKLYASAFAAGGLANAVDNANDYDVIRAIAAQVYRAHGRAAAIMVGIDRAALMELKKDSNGNYIMPPFSTADGTRVAGVRVIPTFELGADEFLGGDLKRYMFNIVEDLTIEVGWINDQFARNQLSVRGEVFGNGLVKNQHQNKIIKGTFTAAKAALETA